MLRGTRLDRYVLRELFTPTLLGLFLYTFVLLMNHFFLVAEKALSKNLPAELTIRLFLIGIPRLLVLSIPMAVLLGTLIAMGRLSADHEWIALHAAGRRPLAMLRPVLLHGLLGSLASFLIYAAVVPRTNYAFRALRGQILFSSNLAADLKPRVFYDLPDGSVLFVDEIRPGGERRLEGVLLLEPGTGPDSSRRLVLARYGDLYPASDGSGALLVDLYDAEAVFYKPDAPGSARLTRFAVAEGHRIEPPDFVGAFLAPPDKVVQDMPLDELWREVAAARQERGGLGAEASSGRRVVSDRRVAVAAVEFHQRLALPLAPLLFAALALPLGVTGVRSGKGAGFAMSLVVILVYRVVFVLARNQAVAGNLPAELGPWVANGVILIWAVVALAGLGRRPVRERRLLGGIVPGLLDALRRRRARRAAATAPGEPETASEFRGLGGTSTRFVRRMDRYVGAAYLRLVLYALASAYVIYGLIELQGLMDDVLRTRQPLSLVAGYFKYFVPTVLHLILPIACLVGAVVAVTLLSRTGELVAIKAAGVGMRRATLPVLGLTVLLCGLLFLVEDRIAPPAQRKAQTIKDRIEGRAPRSHGVPVNGRWSFGPDGDRLYHYRLYDPARREFADLDVFTLDRTRARILDYRFGPRARLEGDRCTVLGGWHRSFDPERYELYEPQSRLTLDGPAPAVGGQSRLAVVTPDLPDQMSLAEIREQIGTLRDSGYDITRLEVALWSKFSHASAPLVMVLLGLPFAFKVGRRGSLYGIGVALLLVLVYWATFAIFNALGLETLLRPAVAALAPNVLFGLLGAYLMLFIRT